MDKVFIHKFDHGLEEKGKNVCILQEADVVFPLTRSVDSKALNALILILSGNN